MRQQLKFQSMKSVRIVSQILLWFTRLLALGYFVSFALSAIALMTDWSLEMYDDDTRYAVLFPFTQQRFMMGDYYFGYMLMFLMILGLYALFFWLLSNVFSVFTKNKLFTESSIARLRWFYLSNFILPASATVIISFGTEIESPMAESLIALHALLGVFTYFIAAIFRQGVHLQNESDLII